MTPLSFNIIQNLVNFLRRFIYFISSIAKPKLLIFIWFNDLIHLDNIVFRWFWLSHFFIFIFKILRPIWLKNRHSNMQTFEKIVHAPMPFTSGGQTITDRINAAKHSLAGSQLGKTICKATTEELMAPKKKHLDCMCFSHIYEK